MDKQQVEFFRKSVEAAAQRAIESRMSTEAGKKAIASVSIAFRTIAAKSPDIYGCTVQSVSDCVVRAATLQLYPGGFMPGADLFVQKGREKVGGQWNDKPYGKWTLEYRPNANGLRALVRRTLGIEVIPIAVAKEDEFEWEEGLVRCIKHKPNPDVEEITEENFRFGYTTWTDKEGNQNFTVVRKGDIMRARAASQSYKTWQDKKRKGETYNPEPTWVGAFHPMVLKTLVLWTIRHCLPMDIARMDELSEAVDSAEDTEAETKEVVVEVVEEKKATSTKEQDRNLLGKKESVPESRQIEAATELEVSMEEAEKEHEKVAVEVVEVTGIRTTTKVGATKSNVSELKNEIEEAISQLDKEDVAEVKKAMGLGPGRMAFDLYPAFLAKLQEKVVEKREQVAEKAEKQEEPESLNEDSDDMP